MKTMKLKKRWGSKNECRRPAAAALLVLWDEAYLDPNEGWNLTQVGENGNYLNEKKILWLQYFVNSLESITRDTFIEE